MKLPTYRYRFTTTAELMPSIPNAAEQILNMPARMAVVPPGVVQIPEALADPTYQTALGLVCYPQTTVYQSFAVGRVPQMRWIRRVKDFFKEMF